MIIHYQFADGTDIQDQKRIQELLERAFAHGDILSCPCAAVEAFVYETRRPDFQASISCSCNIMRPLFSSTPDTEN